MEETLISLFKFLGNKAILMTLLPSLFLNVFIDATKEHLTFKTKAGRIIALNGLISILGLGFGVLYHFLLYIPLETCFLHSMAIVGISYTFYKIGIYNLFKQYIEKKLNKGKANE